MSRTDSPPDAPALQPADPGTETVAIYVDVENVSGGASMTFASDAVDYRALLRTLVDGRTLLHANAYLAMPDGDSPKDAFATALEHVGYQVKPVPVTWTSDGTSHGDADIDITVDILDTLHTATPDRVVLCTGDGDFLPVVTRLQDAGVTVEIASFTTTLSDDLCNAADTVTRLDDAETFELTD